MLTKASKKLRREQLDRALGGPVDLRHLPQPKRGWIREVREVLGMSAQQLADRLRVSQPAVAKMEKAEAAGAVTVASLKKAADALGCHFVYAFVPHDSFEALVRTRAREAANNLLGRVEHTMALEAQGGDGVARERRIQELADELVRTLSRDLWDETGTSKSAMFAGSGK
jgi:predicted DNA-binding mobile mystery protein A